jgi:hypothetical protein
MAIQIDVKCSSHRENHDDDRLRLTDETLTKIIPANLIERGLMEKS